VTASTFADNPTQGDVRPATVPQTLIVPPHGGEEYRILNGRTRIKIAREQTTGGALSIVEQMLPPGGGPLTHVHGNEDEGFYVLEGKITFYFADGPVAATAGTFLHSPQGALHTWRNESREPARMLGLFFPGGFEGYFREVGNPSSYTGPEMTLEEFKHRSVVSGTRFGIRYFFPGEAATGSTGDNHVSRPGEGESLFVVRNHVTIKAGAGQTGSKYVLWEENIPPGALVPMHVHHEEDEAGYILSGELTWLMPDGSPVCAAAGSTVYSPRETPHAWRNDADDVVRMVFVATPSGMDSFFRMAGDPAPPVPPATRDGYPAFAPEMETRLIDAALRHGMELAGKPAAAHD
jgi:quercetin dioxygenase-like cupin family protein